MCCASIYGDTAVRLGGTIRPAQRARPHPRAPGTTYLPHQPTIHTHFRDALEIDACATTSLALRGTTPSSFFTAYAVFLSYRETIWWKDTAVILETIRYDKIFATLVLMHFL